MKRGRPSDEYPAEEFRKKASEKLQALNLTVRQAEDRSGVNRGTISQVLRGLRHCAPEDRHALMVALEFTSVQHERFLRSRPGAVPDLVLYDASLPYSGLYLPVQRGRELLMRSLFPEARRQLNDAFQAALSRRDYVRAADAAEVMAWLESEVMERDNIRALRWATTSIELIEKHVGTCIERIVGSAQSGFRSAEVSVDDEVTPILSKVLHIRSKLLAERVVYYGELNRREEAADAFDQSLMLDGYRQTAAQFGHDFRWQARMLASDRAGRPAAERRIAEAFDHFERGSSGESLVARDRGFVYWQTGQPGRARDALGKAIDLLSVYADARALGPAFYVLSKVAGEADRMQEARRHALVASAFHPYGYVVENTRGHLQISDRCEVDRDIADLLAGKPPFQVVHQVMDRLTNGTTNTSGELIRRNLSRVATYLST